MVALLVGLAAAVGASGQEFAGETPGHVTHRPPPTSEVGRADSPPVIDGVLDEEVWATAPVIDGFRQIVPVEGADPSQRTEVRLLFDEDFLYVGVHCFDAEPDKIIAKEMQRREASRIVVPGAGGVPGGGVPGGGMPPGAGGGGGGKIHLG